MEPIHFSEFVRTRFAPDVYAARGRVKEEGASGRVGRALFFYN
jgi:hypothetical protein